jgi:hypothetical protein
VRNVGRERDLLRRTPLPLAPVIERLAVSADMLASTANCNDNARRWGSVNELPAERRSNAGQLAICELELLFFDEQRQRPAHDQIDLFLLAMAVDATPLPRLERQLIDPEAANIERASQRNEALIRSEVDLRPRDGLHAYED